MEIPLDSLLTVAQVAKICHLRPATVYSAVSRNLLPAVILWKGRRRRVVRFRRADLERFIREHSLPAKTRKP